CFTGARRSRARPRAGKRSEAERCEGRQRSSEGVAAVRVAGLEAGREPVRALGRGAVRPRLRIDLPLRRLLDAVVADCGGCAQRVLHVGLGDLREIARLLRVRSPDPGEAVRLELALHGGARRALPVVADLVEDAEQVLDVVAVLVREDVGLRERARARSEARAQLVEEAEVDVDLLVDGAVERPDVGRRLAAAARGRTGEEHRLRRRVAGKRAAPVGLDAVDVADDPAVLARVRTGAARALLA